MGNLDKLVRDGYYARKQMFSRSRLVSWVHRGRFERAVEIVHGLRPATIIDYGCGDGTMLAMLMAAKAPPKRAVGLELQAESVEQCRSRFRDIPGIEFHQLSDEFIAANGGQYDVVLCTEVLEHVIDAPAIVRDLVRLARPGGTIVVSVPVETGLPLIGKQTVRTVLGWRGVGDYPGTTPYSAGELVRSILAGERQHVVRPVHDDDGFKSHDHKGFNWRVLRYVLRSECEVERIIGSPVRWLPASLNSQVWFVGRRPR